MTKKQIAEALERVADLLELRGENQFKVRAYSNAGRLLRGLDTSLDRFIELVL